MSGAILSVTVWCRRYFENALNLRKIEFVNTMLSWENWEVCFQMLSEVNICFLLYCISPRRTNIARRVLWTYTNDVNSTISFESILPHKTWKKNMLLLFHHEQLRDKWNLTVLKTELLCSQNEPYHYKNRTVSCKKR